MRFYCPNGCSGDVGNAEHDLEMLKTQLAERALYPGNFIKSASISLDFMMNPSITMTCVSRAYNLIRYASFNALLRGGNAALILETRATRICIVYYTPGVFTNSERAASNMRTLPYVLWISMLQLGLLIRYTSFEACQC